MPWPSMGNSIKNSEFHAKKRHKTPRKCLNAKLYDSNDFLPVLVDQFRGFVVAEVNYSLASWPLASESVLSKCSFHFWWIK